MTHKPLMMYAHGSAYNHGCEAIVRSTVDLLSLEKDRTTLFSNKIQGDIAFGLDDLVSVVQVNETPIAHNSLKGICYRIHSHLYPDHEPIYYRNFGREQYQYLYGAGNVALSIGGDNYCYPGALTALDVRNYWLNRKGKKTILWGASLDEALLSNRVEEDLNRYSLITVREQLSYDLLRSRNIRTEVVLAPDPAFALPIQDTPWPDGKQHKNVVGINISHFVFDLAARDMSGIMNYRNLVQWILNETDMEIALIPHVVFPEDNNNNDLLSSLELLKYLPENDRIFLADKPLNCCQLKSLISKCRFFVGARTHATIAAYSTAVPTLVVGYSTKSIGIARNLFGTDTGYVCSVQNMTDDHMLVDTFQQIVLREGELRKHLSEMMPGYIQGHSCGIDAVNQWIR